jgi:hypothetical protein
MNTPNRINTKNKTNDTNGRNCSISVKKINKPIDSNIHNNSEKSGVKTTSNEVAFGNTKKEASNVAQNVSNSSLPSNVEDKKTAINSGKPSLLGAKHPITSANDNAILNKSSENQPANDNLGNTNSSVPQDFSPNENSNNIVASSPTAPSLSTYSEPISTSEAEKYWGGKLLLPSHIPANFELTDISLPNDNKEIYVKLTYNSNNNYFKLTENKNTKYNLSGKSIDINGINATIVENNNLSNSNNTETTQIVWVKNNVQYSIIGNISDTELVSIAKSLD